MDTIPSEAQRSPVFRLSYFLILFLGMIIWVHAVSAVSTTDTDGDGMPDWWETRAFGNGYLNVNQNDAQQDPDNDGLNNLAEYQNGSNPFVKDTDRDGLSDGREVTQYSTNPLIADTDGGGVSDGIEILNGRNPLDPDDDAAGMTDTIHLEPGWNLISLPLVPPNTAVAAVLAPIAEKFISVWSYHHGSWQSYDPDSPGFSDLTVMETGLGYWINMTASGDLPVSGSPASKSIPLNAGWNLVGYGFSAAQDVGAAMASISGKYINIWSFSDGVWKVYDPANPGFSDLTHLHPGRGYWINAVTACTWTLP